MDLGKYQPVFLRGSYFFLGLIVGVAFCIIQVVRLMV